MQRHLGHQLSKRKQAGKQKTELKLSPQDGEDSLKMELSGRRREEHVKQMLTIPAGLSHIVISSVHIFR